MLLLRAAQPAPFLLILPSPNNLQPIRCATRTTAGASTALWCGRRPPAPSKPAPPTQVRIMTLPCPSRAQRLTGERMTG